VARCVEDVDMTEWEKRDEELADAVKKAALELLAHQNTPPARMEIPLGNDLWVMIGPKMSG
jgi:hypothetical protein